MRVTTAGESHGKALVSIIEGIPAGLKLDLAEIDRQLKLRQGGYGRGARQKLESDRAEILAGVRGGVTLGSPVALAVYNSDYENWKAYMAPEGCDTDARKVTRVRPGHADLTGLKKFGGEDARNILERASARETAVRVAAGSVLRQYLSALGVEIAGYVKRVGTVEDAGSYSFDELKNKSGVLGMVDREAEARAVKFIEECRSSGDTCGGVAELRVRGLKSGFGSCMTYAEKLDARLAFALMSVQAIKGVEFGEGFALGAKKGSEAHDEIFYTAGGFVRKTNRAGGIEGGMSNGEELVLRAVMKPIPTLMRGLNTVDYVTKEPARADTERSDACAILACEVVLESAIATELAMAVSERLGGDNMDEVISRYGRLPA